MHMYVVLRSQGESTALSGAGGGSDRWDRLNTGGSGCFITTHTHTVFTIKANDGERFTCIIKDEKVSSSRSIVGGWETGRRRHRR